MSIRLNKLLAGRGVGARRKCDALIQSGAVRVNGRVVTEPGTRVEPERDRVTVSGRRLPRAAELRYYALHKPVGVITTLEDPEGRPTVRELMPPGVRLFPVGRLDADTSGLLVLTNDGELAHHLMHPRYGVEKVYRVRLDRPPDAGQLARLRGGVEFEPGVRSSPARVRVLDATPGASLVQVALHEGRYRQVRRMCEAVGLAVRGLHRSAYGPLRLGPLARGMVRELSEDEVARLRAASARPRPRGRYLSGRGRPSGTGRARPAEGRRASTPAPARSRSKVTARAGAGGRRVPRSTRTPRAAGAPGRRPSRGARSLEKPRPSRRGERPGARPALGQRPRSAGRPPTRRTSRRRRPGSGRS